MSPEALGRYADAAAAALDLPLSPEHRPGVLQYLALAARLAEAVHAVPLSADDESAMVFEPVSPMPHMRPAHGPAAHEQPSLGGSEP